MLSFLALKMCLSKFRASYQDMCSAAACDVRLCDQAVTRIHPGLSLVVSWKHFSKRIYILKGG